MISEDDFRQVMPARHLQTIPSSLLANLNSMLEHPDLGEQYREGLITYQSVLKEGKFKLDQYMSAVTYVTNKLRGITNKEAYYITFPDKVKDWDSRGMSEKDRSTFIAIYHKSKLVSRILEQSIIPTWVINQDMFQEALNVQQELMRYSEKPMVRHLAAKAIMDTLKRPEAAELKIDIGVKENSVLEGIQDSIKELVAQQRKNIESGFMDVKDVAELPLSFSTGGGEDERD